jgi:hypothetical protein
VNNPAIFSAHTLLRELPRKLLLERRALETQELLSLMKTPHLSRKEMQNSVYAFPSVRLQRVYLELLRFAHKAKPFQRALLETAMRAGNQNRAGYATGDGIIHVVDFLLKSRRRLSRNDVQALIEAFIGVQRGLPVRTRLRKGTRKALERLIAIVEENRFSI